MNDFHKALTYVRMKIYEPIGFAVQSMKEEIQNKKYGAGTFQLSTKMIRFRVANITPNKVGQFVAIWEKDENNKNQAFSYEASPELLVITTFKNTEQFGQFLFPKEILLEKGILRGRDLKGKMAIRVYPTWDQPKSKQAITTQKWQQAYFVDMSNAGTEQMHQLKKMYGIK